METSPLSAFTVMNSLDCDSFFNAVLWCQRRLQCPFFYQNKRSACSSNLLILSSRLWSGVNGGGYQGFNSDSSVVLNEWNHVTIVRDLTNGNLYWYINGKLVKQTSANYSAAVAGGSECYSSPRHCVVLGVVRLAASKRRIDASLEFKSYRSNTQNSVY